MEDTSDGKVFPLQEKQHLWCAYRMLGVAVVIKGAAYWPGWTVCSLFQHKPFQYKIATVANPQKALALMSSYCASHFVYARCDKSYHHWLNIGKHCYSKVHSKLSSSYKKEQVKAGFGREVPWLYEKTLPFIQGQIWMASVMQQRGGAAACAPLSSPPN